MGVILHSDARHPSQFKAVEEVKAEVKKAQKPVELVEVEPVEIITPKRNEQKTK